jgi:type IV secretion system protein VirB10
MIEKKDPNNAADALRVYRASGSGAYSPVEAGAQVPLGDDAVGNADRWLLHSTVQTPKSPYVLQPGSTISATLETGVNSELPGMVVARVNADVCDTPTGQHLLIPSGSMLVGQYANKIAYGAKRVFLAFNRINFPDGTWLDIGAMPGVSDDGTSGAADQVDTHFWTTFGHALLMSVITAGVAISQPHYGNGYDSQNASQELSAALGQNLGTAMSMLFEKDINRSPTIRLRPGLTFSVMVSRDVYFPAPYNRPSYTVRTQATELEGK